VNEKNSTQTGRKREETPTGIENARPETTEIAESFERLREWLPFDPLEFIQVSMPDDKRPSHRTDTVD
jgi:hypothetical protein